VEGACQDGRLRPAGPAASSGLVTCLPSWNALGVEHTLTRRLHRDIMGLNQNLTIISEFTSRCRVEIFSVRVAVHGSGEAWGPVCDALRGAPDVELVTCNGEGERVDVVLYDVDAPGVSRAIAALREEHNLWTVGVDLDQQRVVELSASQYALTSVDGLAAVIAASGCAIRPAGERTPARVR